MKRSRACRPSLHSLEERAALSGWFSNMLHSVLPFLGSSSSNKPRTNPAATTVMRSHLAAQRAENQQRSQSLATARNGNDAAPDANAPAGPLALAARQARLAAREAHLASHHARLG